MNCEKNVFLPLTSCFSPEEILDTALHKMQSEGIKPIEWHILLHRRMNVPRVVSDFSFLVPDKDFSKTSKLLECIGLPLQAPSELSLFVGGDMHAKGHFHRMKLSDEYVFDYCLVVYPLSFSGLRPCEISEQPVQYSKLHRCSRILVPRPSAVYASHMRMMLRYPVNSATWLTLQSDMGQLMLYHLMGYTLETISDDDEEDEYRRVDDGLQIIREWSARKEWGDGEEWMENALCGLVRGDRSRFPPDCKASS